jgi:hypothetical protein
MDVLDMNSETPGVLVPLTAATLPTKFTRIGALGAPMSETPSESTTDVVLNHAGLFRYSGMVDALRDATNAYAKPQAALPASETVADLVEQYNALRKRVLGTLAPAMAEDGEVHTRELDATADIHAVRLAASLLSRFADLAIQQPDFIASMEAAQMGRTMKLAEIKSVYEAKMAEYGAADTASSTVPTATAGTGTGQYL